MCDRPILATDAAAVRVDLDEPRTHRKAAVALFALAAGGSAFLVTWLSRGGTFWPDELAWFSLSPHLSPSSLLEPHFGHLIALPRLLYAAALEAGGQYVGLRILHPLVTIAAAALFFAYTRRRIGSLAALPPSVLLMFYGADWHNVLIPIGITVIGGIAFGLAALVALDRNDGRGDVLACVALCLGVATFSNALPFLVATAILIGLRADRRGRIWIVAVPAVIYAAWFLTEGSAAAGPEGQTSLANVLQAPQWAFESLAIVLASFSGLGYTFDTQAAVINPGPGYPLAVAALVGLAWLLGRLERGARRNRVIAMLAVPIALWTLGALASGVAGRAPDNPRYLFAGATAVLLVGVEAGAGRRPARGGLIAIGVIAVVATAMNVALLRDGRQTFYARYSDATRAALTGLDLARDHVADNFDAGAAAAQLDSPWRALREAGAQPTRAYLDAAQRYGSPGFTLAELARQSDADRALTDRVLAAAYGLALAPASAPPPAAECQQASVATIPPATTAWIQAPGAPVTLRRFADADSIPLGSAEARWTQLRLPADDLAQPWELATANEAVRICLERAPPVAVVPRMRGSARRAGSRRAR